ncbi:helix-turn-helix domain-containing protein (plasmid) [Bosea sp. F3-2]|uniref:IclR family transcriptional regulator domain-containing protein n=1 Tax=Bosea sp. F3-2 TaxID=2599640 RepID=UPI0011EDC224|nr:IclR family transcriptional regulator C-terminal domain-containing protein [Bosea sp. F3-2]QEL27308.1 helix-turn-helix domain-containing protein [Bosea sp. F3-2]
MSDLPAAPQTWDAEAAGRPEAVAGTQLIGKAFRLIDMIAEAPGHIDAGALTAATGWPKATLYRILSAVVAQGYVRLDPIAQGYTLGYRLLELAQNVWTAPDLAAVASIELQRLRDMTGETAYLAVLHDGAVLSLGKFESPHEVRSAAKLGVRKPIHCTSQGKAILAYLKDDEADALLTKRPLERFTPQTITDLDYLRAQLQVVRSRGYAVEDQEILLGNRCVGAPVLDVTGRPIAAISVAAPIYRLTEERVEQLGPEVALAARNIGLALRSAPARPATSKALSSESGSDAAPAFYGAHPVWSSTKSCLLWADRLAPCLYASRERRSVLFRPDPSQPIDGVAVGPDDIAIVVSGKQLAEVNDKGESTVTEVCELAGTTTLAHHPDGQIWAAVRRGDDTRISSVQKGGALRDGWNVRGHITALAWSKDGTELFAADPERGTIHRFESRKSSGRLFARVLRVSGEPRSLAIDSSGRLWVGLYDGWSAARLSEEGEIENLLPLPVPRPTGIAFDAEIAGKLYVTTARIGLSREVLRNAPLSGQLLTAHSSLDRR